VFTAFRLLAKLRGLRGTAFDVFGYTHERRMERQLIGEYEATIDELIGKLGSDNHALAVKIASIPEEIRGYGHVKKRSLDIAKAKQADLLTALRSPEAVRSAA
jgi:indolepyruvate ferredoxin oxidoreductase